MLLTLRSTSWLSAYVLFAILPLILGLFELDAGRGFWINFSVAMGFVALSMLGLQFLLAARTRVMSDQVGMDVVLRFHRQITYVALVLVFAHPIVLFVTDSRFLPLLNVFTSPLRAKFAVASVLCLVVLVVISVWRSQLGLSYATWQVVHAVLAVLVVTTALAHTVLVGYYVRTPWEEALWILLTIAFVGLGIWVRIIKPLLRRHRRWIVEEVVPDAGGSTKIVLRLMNPDSYGPKGFNFRAGQFAWILMFRSPFAITYHPFSFSSSAEQPDRIHFTIKAFGEFTKEVGRLTPGEIVYLDGPYGSFSLTEDADAPVVLIGGGVGATPLASMLETLADRGDPRPCIIFLANRDLDSRTCGAQIDRLAARLNLTIVDVLAEPPPDWPGETGYLNRSILDRHLPDDPQRAQYFVCGPPGLMDAVDVMLLDLEIPPAHVHAERFGMV